MILMKTCTKCEQLKSFDDFSKRPAYKDGLAYWCKLCIRQNKKTYYNNNLEQSRMQRAAYDAAHREECNARKRTRYSWRWHNDPIFRIIKNQRNRLHELVVNKPTSFSKSVGCNSTFLRQYLESKFQPGMTWDNYGKWEIDHIRPLVSFDLEDAEQFKQACHHTNLQPLWEKDNIAKSDKWENKNEN